MESKKKPKKFALLIHRLYKDGTVKRGGADYIASYLFEQGYLGYLVEHPLENGGRTVTTGYNGVKKVYPLLGSGFARWIQEVILNVVLLCVYRPTLVVAVDPLNFLAALIFKRIFGARVIFHSIDYSEKRFKSSLLNSIYKLLYKLAVFNADSVTYVSLRMGDKIKEFWGYRKSDRFVYFPNSPEFEKIVRVDPSKKKTLKVVYTKSLISDTEVNLLLEIASLIDLTKPSVKFQVIGLMSNKSEDKLKRSSFSKIFELTGLVGYEENIDLISKAYIGFAWYEGKKEFEKYADSLKIREYAAAGLPSVCNDVVSTCIEMQRENAGIIATNADTAAGAIKRLIEDEVLYNRLRDGALSWAQKVDKNAMLKKLFAKQRNSNA